MSFGNKIQDIKEAKNYMVAGVLSFRDEETGGYKPVGNIESLSIEASPSKVQKKETQSGKNAVIKEIVTENIPTISIEFSDFNLDNIARFVYGETTATIEASSVTTDVVAKLDSLVTPGFIMGGVVTVEDETQTITYEEGKNYEVQDFDIFIYDAATQTAKGAAEIITEGDIEDTILKITADKPAQAKVSAFTKNSIEVAARFTGVNTADNNSPVIFEFPKLSLDPASMDALSTQDFGTASVSGTILKAVGHSELYTIHVK